MMTLNQPQSTAPQDNTPQLFEKLLGATAALQEDLKKESAAQETLKKLDAWLTTEGAPALSRSHPTVGHRAAALVFLLRSKLNDYETTLAIKNSVIRHHDDTIKNMESHIRKQSADLVDVTDDLNKMISRQGLTINQLIEEAHTTAKEKGWWDEGRCKTVAECLCLIHSEISEALEEVRNPGLVLHFGVDETGKPHGFDVELADAIIRIADLCGRLDINLEKALHAKLAYNKMRPTRHGGKKL